MSNIGAVERKGELAPPPERSSRPMPAVSVSRGGPDTHGPKALPGSDGPPLRRPAGAGLCLPQGDCSLGIQESASDKPRRIRCQADRTAASLSRCSGSSP